MSLKCILQGQDSKNLATKVELNEHIADKDNPHEVTAEQVGADIAGTAEKVQTNLDSHIANKNNPHQVTNDQIGALQAVTEMVSSTATIDVPKSVSDINALSPGSYGWVGNTRLDWMPEEVNGNLCRYELTVRNTKYKNQNLTVHLRCIDGAYDLRDFIGEASSANNQDLRWAEIVTTRSGADYTVYRAKHQTRDTETDIATTYLRDTAFSATEKTPSVNGTIIWQYS